MTLKRVKQVSSHQKVTTIQNLTVFFKENLKRKCIPNISPQLLYFYLNYSHLAI